MNETPATSPGRDQSGRPPAFLYLLIFIAGLSFSLLGAMLPDISRTFGLTNAAASTLPLAQFSGDFAGLLVLGLVTGRPRTLLFISSVTLATGAAAIGMIAEFSTGLKIAFFFFGAASGILITLPGMIVSRMAEGGAARAMNVLYAFFSAGVMAAPAASGALVAAGVDYRMAFFALSMIAAVGMAFSALSPLPCPDLGEGLRPGAVRELIHDHRLIFFTVLVMNLCYVGAEAVPNAWIPKYLNDTFPGFSEWRGALILTMFWGAITAGRFICAAVLGRGASPRAMLGGLAGLACACLVVAPLFKNRLPAEAAFVLSGFFFSGIFPIIISYTEKLPSSTSGSMFILVMAAGMLGASVAGRSVGIIAEHLSFRAGMGLSAAMCLVVIILIPVLGSSRR